MAATADQPVLNALDILRSALERGVTGRLSRASTRGPGREIYVMQGQILAAHGPDDGPWIVRRLVNSGALTERQGKAFIRRLTRGIPFEELILGHVPDSLLESLLAGRFRQNLLDFLSSPPPIDFQPMDTLFVPNLQSGHDTGDVLEAVVALRERIGPLMRHRGALTLRLGPSMPASRDEARLVDLCDPPISLRDLLTYSPFETGETLDHVIRMLNSGALVSDEGIRLKSTRGRGPTADYAVEELFTLEGPPTPEVQGTPAGPIVPDHLALLREEAEAPVLGDFGRVPPAFRGDEDVHLSPDLPGQAASHLVLVPEASDPSLSPDRGGSALDSIVPVLVEPSVSLTRAIAEPSAPDLTTPSTGLFEDTDLLEGNGELLGRDVPSDDDPFAAGSLLDDSPRLFAPDSDAPADAPSTVAEPVVVELDDDPPEPPAAVVPPAPRSGVVDDSVPESWRNLSALGFEPPPEPPAPDPSTAERPTEVLAELASMPGADDLAVAESVPPAPAAAPASPAEPTADASPFDDDLHDSARLDAHAGSGFDDGALSDLAPPDDADPFHAGAFSADLSHAPESAWDDAEDPVPVVAAAEPDDVLDDEPSVVPYFDAMVEDVLDAPSAGIDPVSPRPVEPAFAEPPPATARIEAPVAAEVPASVDVAEAVAAPDGEDADLHAVDADDPEPTPAASAPPEDDAATLAASNEDALLFGGDDDEDDVASDEDALLFGGVDEDDAASDEDALLFADDESEDVDDDFDEFAESLPPAAEAPADPTADPAPAGGSALLDAARRYLEEASERRQKQNRKPPEPVPEPLVASSGERKFTGFDFDVDDTELAMFDDHDRYRGGGQGQFTLNKELLDKVELLPAAPPPQRRVRMGAPDPLPEEDSLIEMGEASAEEIAEAGVVALAFSAPSLDADQVQYKIGVAGEVAEAIVRQLDLTAGQGMGQTTVQLLVDAAAGPFARLFHGVIVAPDGSLDEERIFMNLQQRPETERRSLLDRGVKDFIERALSTGAEELPDEALDALLSEIAGYQQRLRM